MTPRARAAAAALFALACACVHHPRRAELNVESKREALERCSHALRRRFANVLWSESERGLLFTDARLGGDDALSRTRAYVALTPGERGWEAEITVVEERLVETDLMGFPAAPRWEFARRDRALEEYLVAECERGVAGPASAPADRS